MLQRWLLMFHLFCTGSGGPLPDPGEIRAGKDRAAAMVDDLRRQAGCRGSECCNRYLMVLQ
uniref:Uncharacterized protein n=1 Tax=Setaria viridis TaxID=4556 RepID=A0A4V6D8F7_SETVI|nr:hypothetical protein SEVIR_4G168301v2 [Setaria viridis]